MNDASDRNLLIGVLAFNNGFVDQPQLVEAMRDWMENKSRSLAVVLRERQVISTAEQELLLALVERHLQRFDGDSQAGYEHLSGLSGIGIHLDTLGEPGQEGSIDTVLQTRRDEGAEKRPVESTDNAATSLRFRKLHSHARGGLGEVFLAEDRELSRQVALKEIQSRAAASQQDRLRFIREAEVTGQLEHPGIVPVYGLGRYPDGRPFYAMKFIKGQSLQEGIQKFHADKRSIVADESRRMQLRSLLQRFVDVCNAMHYAHSRGVLHRDLKPANIMLGHYGETLVVDWGLARVQGEAEPTKTEAEGEHSPVSLSGSNDSQTQAGSLLGTPAYMSPEQAAGMVEVLDARSDIYSLGATLYELLTGQPPFARQKITELLKKVRRGEYVKPREVAASIPSSLEAICLKAMAREQSDRYTTAEELAADIDRWLADEPVSVYREPITLKMNRWVRRHRTIFASAMTAVVVLMIGMTSEMAHLSAAHQRECDLRMDVEKNFLLAKQTVDDFYVKVSEETLLDQPGTQPVRKELLGRALTYYDKFMQQRPDDPSLQDDRALAQFYRGQIQAEIASMEEAFQTLKQAADWQRARTAANGNRPEDRYRLANIYNQLGTLYVRQQKWTEARTQFTETETLRSQLAEQLPKNVEHQRKLANVQMNLGFLAVREQKVDAAKKLYSQAQQRRLQAREGAENSLQLTRDLALGYFNQAILHVEQNQIDEAIQALRNARNEFEVVVEQQPADFRTQQKLAQTETWLAEMLWFQKQPDDALKLQQAARTTLERITLANPQADEFRTAMVRLLLNTSRWQTQQNEREQAMTTLEDAISHSRQLTRKTLLEDAPAAYRDLAMALLARGELQIDADPQAAREQVAEAEKILQQLTREFPDDESYRQLREKAQTLRTERM